MYANIEISERERERKHTLTEEGLQYAPILFCS